ncbi:slit homolog 1 protein-like, partial [Octopus sinensis]|uniref:Slit homolog 1 protein-like n=1 Tax=Octopus sinensis TaxID=2607531 RepID=A0A7E6EJ74_9MOLL
ELGDNNLNEIKTGTLKSLPSLTTLSLWGNAIKEISAETFQNLKSLSTLNLRNNIIAEIKPDTFQSLSRLKILNLGGNNIKEIKTGTFQHLTRLIYLYLRNNRIQNFEDGTFLFLPSLTKIDLKENRDMRCGCHLPALVNYVNRTFNIDLNVQGECQTDPGNNQNKIIPIMEFSQCQNYSLFQRNLQCQTCSRMTCSASDVRSCPEAEPVCRRELSLDGVTLKFEKSCSTYRKCLEDIRNNTFTCNKWTSGTSCVACCTGNLCNKNNFIGSNNSFVFHLIFNSILKKSNEDIARSMEHELSYLTGTFEVAYCGSEKNSEVFTINCTVPRTITKDQIFKQVSETFKTSQTLRDLGLQQRNTELFDEMFCNEDSTTTSNNTFHWPMTKIGTSVTIPCHANVATRYWFVSIVLFHIKL